MLQRAASNAYSWWWASHIRTKQSKWLEQNLQDIEEKVKHALTLLEDEGESFAKRAEMYYKRRPELINLIEETYKAYRALAERYDHMSTELQNANTTFASLFPDQFPRFSMDYDYDDNEAVMTPKFAKRPPEMSKPDPDIDKKKSNIPSVPDLPKKDLKRIIEKFQPKKPANASKDASKENNNKSGLSRAEAVDETDKLQKEILALQAEKEIVRSSFESGLTKYWEIEKQIIEKQERVYKLKDEFNIEVVIKGAEAQRLMAEKAIKACDERLAELEERHESALSGAKAEGERIKESKDKLKLLVKEETSKAEETKGSLENGTNDDRQKTEELELLQGGNDKSLTLTELAERIDDLANKVISLEAAVMSQTILIRRLRAESNDLLARFCNLDERVKPTKDRSELKNEIRELKEKLKTVQDLHREVEDKSEQLRNQFRHMRLYIIWLSEKQTNVRPDKEVETNGSTDVNAKKESEEECKPEVQVKDHQEQKTDAINGLENSLELHKESGERCRFKLRFKDQDEKRDQEGRVDPGEGDKTFKGKEANEAACVEDREQGGDHSQVLGKKVQCQKPDYHSDKQMATPRSDSAYVKGTCEQREEIHWRDVPANGTEDGKKLLSYQYTTVLQKLKSLRKKLSEAENDNAMKDEEIRLLYQKLYTLQNGLSGNGESDGLGGSGHQNDRSKALSPGEEQFGTRINAMQEENLDLWLRFSASIGKIPKFDAVIKGLKEEITKIKKKRKEDAGDASKYTLRSDIRPVFRHLKETNTQLTAWLEASMLLEDELILRSSSLSKIQNEVTKALDSNFSGFEAARLQGEVANMKQENRKMSAELQAGSDHATELLVEVERILARLKEEFSVSNSRNSRLIRRLQCSESRSRIPLRSFLFGTKAKKQKPSIFSCMHPSLYRKSRTGI